MGVRRLVLRVVAVLLAVSGVLGIASASALAAKEFVPDGTFGSLGSGNGELERQQGIAVNDSTEPLTEPAAGDVYVADTRNDRIEIFSAEGGYISQFGVDIGEPTLIALDDSNNPLDPAAGDLYASGQVFIAGVGEREVVEQYSSTGVQEGRLTGTCAAPGTCAGNTIPFGSIRGLAVDSTGDLWVETEKDEGVITRSLDEFSDTGSFIKELDINLPNIEHGLAVDSVGNLYVITKESVAKLNGTSGEELGSFGEGVEALAVDPSTNDVLTDNRGKSVTVYGPFGEPYSSPLGAFVGEAEAENSYGIAMNDAGVLYLSQPNTDRVQIFSDALTVPRTAGASGVGETDATLHGTLNPNGETVTECRFEYGPGAGNYSQSVPCAQTPAQIGKGVEPVAVSVELTGLQPRTSNHFRLVGVNARGTTFGKDESVYTFGHPLVEGESVAGVLSASASVSALVNAGGVPTSYRVEYGPTEKYGSSTKEVNLGTPQEAVEVIVPLSGLQSHTLYHARVVATNALGVANGGDLTFQTIGAAVVSSTTLPDNRSFELVSSPTSNADVYPPVGEVAKAPNRTYHLVRAAASGNGVVYQADPGKEGGAGDTGGENGNAYIAARGEHGWTQTNLQLFNSLVYEGFSGELSVGVLQPELSGASEYSTIRSAVPSEPANCYRQPIFSFTSASGEYHSLVSSTLTQAPTDCYGEFAGGNEGTGSVAQYSHILLQSNIPLTPEAIESKAPVIGDLYDSVNGQLHLVSVLPNGQPTAIARFAGDQPIDGEDDVSLGDGNVGGSTEGAPEDISADGSRVFWTTVEQIAAEQYSPIALYLRENDSQPQSPVVDGGCTVSSDACTLQIDAAQPGAEGQSGGGLFRAASSDGSRVFFTDESRLTVGSTAAAGEPDLYEYQVSEEVGKPGKLVDLTVDANAGEHANVLGLMGVSADGSYVYFGADGKLTTGKNVEGREPVAGETNFYVAHDGVTTFIATADPNNEVLNGLSGEAAGDLFLDAAHRTAEVTPDGLSVLFRSRTSLTGYDNLGLPEVFVYDAEDGRISCASCDPTGAPPTEDVSPYEEGAMLTVSYDSDFMLRWMSGNGARAFFVTAQPLVSQDINGLQDVYEWERPASGSEQNNTCTTSSSNFSEVNRGCISILSGGVSDDDSYFLDASASGDDVFIRSRDHLGSLSTNENMALYDARVDGGFPETKYACTGTGCQGVPPTGPIFATPSSATFNGVGNFSPHKQQAVKVTKKIVKCAKGKKLVRGKCVKRKSKTKKADKKRSKRNGRKS